MLRDILILGKRRFREFRASPEGIASNILTDRLRRLEESGFVARDRDPEDGRRLIYTATESGRSLIPVLLELAAWGAEHTDSILPADFAARYRQNRDAWIADPALVYAEMMSSANASSGDE